MRMDLPVTRLSTDITFATTAATNPASSRLSPSMPIQTRALEGIVQSDGIEDNIRFVRPAPGRFGSLSEAFGVEYRGRESNNLKGDSSRLGVEGGTKWYRGMLEGSDSRRNSLLGKSEPTAFVNPYDLRRRHLIQIVQI